MSERLLLAGAEVRAEGRRLSGDVIVFGDTSPSHRERFEPGSLRLAEAVHLDLYHDRERAVAWWPGGGLELRQDDRAMTMTAELPPIPAADRALEEVRSGRTTGLSVEFHARRESRDGAIRVVEEAVLSGIGLVRSPSYELSKVEARARRGVTLQQRVPTDTELSCMCAGVQCRWAEIIGPAMQEAWDEIMQQTFGDTLAVRGSYGTPLGSVSTGSVRAVYTGDEAFVHIDLPEGPGGDAVLRDVENTGAVRARPYLDRDLSRGEERISRTDPNERVMHYSKIAVRSFVIGATDMIQGWPEPELIRTPDEVMELPPPPRPALSAPEGRDTRRRAWWWL